MGMFSSIIDRIFHHASGNAAAAGAGTSTAQPSGQRPSTAAAPASPSAGAPAASAPKLENVDVQAVLAQAAAKKGGGGNWQTSIVDLLKLLDLDSSLSARKDLANELNVHAGADGSAEQNIALQKAVMAKIAENGGKGAGQPPALKGTLQATSPDSHHSRGPGTSGAGGRTVTWLRRRCCGSFAPRLGRERRLGRMHWRPPSCRHRFGYAQVRRLAMIPHTNRTTMAPTTAPMSPAPSPGAYHPSA
jgi:hypothetical protein